MSSNDQAFDELRSVLLGSERDALAELTDKANLLAAQIALSHDRHNGHEATLSGVAARDEELSQQIHALQTGIATLRERISKLQRLVEAPDDRAQSVSEVLVDAVAPRQRDVGVLGEALKPEVEHAIHVSARTDSVILAEALYPVMGPALRKMIADLFTIGDGKSKVSSFQVSEVLLLERSSGVLLAASPETSDNEDSAVVSGMLDAIRLFVEEAFNSPEHDGLQDLRVGDTSILVEWGPDALLASIVRGIPTPEYRAKAALTLEAIHTAHADDLDSFSGAVAPFQPAEARLRELREGTLPNARSIARNLSLSNVTIVVLLMVIVVLLVILL